MEKKHPNKKQILNYRIAILLYYSKYAFQSDMFEIDGGIEFLRNYSK